MEEVCPGPSSGLTTFAVLATLGLTAFAAFPRYMKDTASDKPAPPKKLRSGSDLKKRTGSRVGVAAGGEGRVRARLSPHSLALPPGLVNDPKPYTPSSQP